jgi:hypothetical protein
MLFLQGDVHVISSEYLEQDSNLLPCIPQALETQTSEPVRCVLPRGAHSEPHTIEPPPPGNGSLLSAGEMESNFQSDKGGLSRTRMAVYKLGNLYNKGLSSCPSHAQEALFATSVHVRSRG